MNSRNRKTHSLSYHTFIELGPLLDFFFPLEDSRDPREMSDRPGLEEVRTRYYLVPESAFQT